MAPIEKAIRASVCGAGAVAIFLAKTDNPQEYAATLSIVARDWCAKAWRDGAPRQELAALRAAARFARQVHLRLERCAEDGPMAVYQAVNGNRKGFRRPIPGLLPCGELHRRLEPYRVANTRAKHDPRKDFAPYVVDIRPWWARRAA